MNAEDQRKVHKILKAMREELEVLSTIDGEDSEGARKAVSWAYGLVCNLLARDVPNVSKSLKR